MLVQNVRMVQGIDLTSVSMQTFQTANENPVSTHKLKVKSLTAR